ncbi:hypothetical protein CLOP_g24736 [Closterium sp. NIES-67]|nr:hypothetical protein CLOP_g24736 [Closterium sp. NIES-67]
MIEITPPPQPNPPPPPSPLPSSTSLLSPSPSRRSQSLFSHRTSRCLSAKATLLEQDKSVSVSQSNSAGAVLSRSGSVAESASPPASPHQLAEIGRRGTYPATQSHIASGGVAAAAGSGRYYEDYGDSSRGMGGEGRGGGGGGGGGVMRGGMMGGGGQYAVEPPGFRVY